MNEIREELAKIFLQRPSPYLGADRVLALPIRTVTEACPECEGVGYGIRFTSYFTEATRKIECLSCHGSGIVTRTITLAESLDDNREVKRVIPGCQHPIQRMIEWAENGACPICLTADVGMKKELLEKIANFLSHTVIQPYTILAEIADLLKEWTREEGK